MKEFLTCLAEDLNSFPYHVFRTEWQHRQMSKCIKDTTQSGSQVVLLMDFSENYRCTFRDEVQSGYFDQQQVTVHPMMAYYQEEGSLVKHAIIGISPDVRHDAALVKAFEEKTFDVLQSTTCSVQSADNHRVDRWLRLPIQVQVLIF